MVRLVGKTAIITGAGSDVGAATAVRFAPEGAQVLVVELNESGAEELARSISDAGGRATALRTDVSDNRQVESCIAKAVELFEGIDVLINNAGMSSSQGTHPEVDPWETSVASVRVRSASGIGRKLTCGCLAGTSASAASDSGPCAGTSNRSAPTAVGPSEADPKAIGYILKSDVDDRVKVILTLE